MLGDFGTQRPTVDEQFGYFGETIRVNPNFSDLAVIEMLRAVEDPNSPADARTIVEALAHPEDVDVFLKTSVANRQAVQDLIDLAIKLIGALAGRPTSLPSDSSAGQQNTDTSSTDDSSSRAVQILEGRGRPDLAVAVLRTA